MQDKARFHNAKTMSCQSSFIFFKFDNIENAHSFLSDCTSSGINTKNVSVNTQRPLTVAEVALRYPE